MRRAISLILSLLIAAPAQATVLGNYPSFERSLTVFGDREVTGNTLMIYNNNVNKVLMTDGSEGSVTDVPRGATVEAAYLFWSGTYENNPDRTVDLTLPNGTVLNELHVSRAQPGEDPAVVQGRDCETQRRHTEYNNGSISFDVDFFYCRRDITHTLRSLGADINGTYRVSDVQALPGWPQDGRAYQAHPQWKCANSGNLSDLMRYGCQAMYAGWSMVVVWSHPDQRVRRNITLNDGFLLLDDDEVSGGITQVQMRNFTVAEGASGEFAFFGLEGDPDYGSNQEDLPPGSQCIGCWDFVAMRTSGNNVETQLSAEPGNAAGNVWNGSVMAMGGGVTPGVDIDVYDVGRGGLGILREGDTTATFRMGTGDGQAGRRITRNPFTIHGDGELVLLGWSALSLDVVAPNLNNAATRKSVSRASAGPGDQIQYQVTVTNDGSAPASDVRIVDVMPSGTTYVAGSTATSCGVPSPDVNGESALVQGLNLGSLAHEPVSRASCTITFSVRVNDDAEAGLIIRNSAQISSVEQAQFSTNQVQTQIVGPSLGTPLMTVADLNGGQFEIGDTIQYRMLIPNIGASGAAGLTLSDQWPVQLGNPIVVAPGTTHVYDADSRRLTISGISAAGNSTTEINVIATIIGASPALVSNQFSLSADFLVQDLLSDDPNVPGPTDPTVFGVVDGPNLSASTKVGEDVNGAPLVPGDQVRYIITLNNSGNREAALTLTDTLAAPLQGCTLQSFDAGLMNASCDGQTLTVSGRLPAGERRTVVVLTTVGAAPDGTRIRNVASLSVRGEVDAELAAADLVVARGGLLVTSFIEAEDLSGAPLTPGDEVELRFVARNSGGAPVRGLSISSLLDPRLTRLSQSDGGLQQGATLRWSNLGDLAAGATRTITARVRVQAGLAAGTIITVRGTFEGDGLDPFQAEPVELVIDAEAAMGLSKAVAPADDGEHNPGDLVRYTIVLSNDSDVLLRNAQVTDALPDGLQQWVAGSGGVIADGRATWTAETTPALASLAPGGRVELALSGRIASPMEDRRELINQARASSPGLAAVLSDDPATELVGDPTSITVRSETTLVVEKRVEPAQAQGAYEPGTEAVYTLRIGAGGNQRARGLVVTDVLPDGVTYVASQPAAAVAGQTLTWSAAQAPGLGNLNPGTEELIEVTVRIDPRALNGTQIANQAMVRGETINGTVASNDPTTPEVDDPTVFLVGGVPDVRVQKTVEESVGDGLWRVGETIRYNILLRNNGSVDAVDLSILDPIDPNLSEVRVDGDWGVVADGRISGSVARLNAGRDLTLSFTARIGAVPDGSLVVNQASLRVAGSNRTLLSDDPSLDGEADPTVITVTAEEGVSLLKTVEDLNGGTVLPGDQLRYRLAVTNTGQTPVAALVITDPIDARLEIIGVEDGLRGEVDGQTVRFSVGGLEPGETAEGLLRVRVVQGVSEGEEIANQASLVVDGEDVLSDDGVVGNNDPTPTTVVVGELPEPDLTLSKTVEPRRAQRGQEISYTLTLANHGDAAIGDVLLQDQLPEGLELLAVEGAQDRGGSVEASISLEPGEEHRVRIRARVGFGAGEQISNQASADSVVGRLLSDDPELDGEADATVLSIDPAPFDPELTKTALDLNGGVLEPGDQVQYTLTLRNRGTEALPVMTLIDRLDPALDYVEGTMVVNGDLIDGPYPLEGGIAVPAGLVPGAELGLQFTVVVSADAEQGQLISNQALLRDPQGVEHASDDPALPGGPQPTMLEVGAAGAVSAAKSVAPEAIGLGEQATWTIELLSGANGPRSVALSDVLPRGLRYVPGSLSLDGMPLSDASDDDEGAYDPGLSRVTLNLDLGPQRPRAVLTLRSEATSSNRSVVNQALIDVNGRIGLSDGDPATPGQQGTTLRLLPSGPSLEAELLVADENGGEVDPGDRLRYELHLSNQGDTELVVPAGAMESRLGNNTFVEGSGDPIALAAAGQILRSAAELRIAAGERATLSFATVVPQGLAAGTPVTNNLTIAEPSPWEGSTQLFVGEPAPGATVRGSVYLRSAPDRKLTGWTVRVVNSADPEAYFEAVTDEAGAFEFGGLTWPRAELAVANAAGTEFYSARLGDLEDGQLIDHGCAIDPSGVIYDQVSGAPIAGATVTLLYDVSGDPVRIDDLPEGQQGQVTGADGFYRFDVQPPHVYRLQVTPPTEFHSFPSAELRPVGGTLSSRHGRPSRMSESPDKEAYTVLRDDGGEAIPGRAVVPEPEPDAAARMSYFLRFNIAKAEDAVFHNHVPIDPLRKQVRLSRRASKRSVSAGDLVTFTVEVDNRSNVDLAPSLDGGPELLDLLPPGLLLLRDDNGRAREAFEHYGAGGARAQLTHLRSEGDGALRRLSGFKLAPGERLVWTYRAQVSGSIGAGQLISSNQLVTIGGRVPIAEPAEHRLVVSEDAVLREATLIGRVYCDRNGDGHPSANEEGVPGVRIYGDHGIRVDSDGDGRFHFSRLNPGLHRFKVDLRTLPPGLTLIGLPGQNRLITAGVPSTVDYPVQCAKQLARAEEVRANPMAEGRVAPPPPAPPAPIRLVVDMVGQTVEADGKPLSGPRVGAAVTVEDGDPSFDLTQGPNLDPAAEVVELHARVAGSLPITAWQWQVVNADGKSVYSESGNGAAPELVRWSVPEKIKRDQRLTAQLRVTDAGGDSASSPLIPIGLGLGLGSVDMRRRVTKINEVNGRLFTDGGATPTPRMRGWFADRSARLRADETIFGEFTVFGASPQKGLDAMVWTERRARAIEGMLLAAGVPRSRFSVRAMGNTRKLAPETNERLRKLNRRVEMRLRAVATEHPPVAPEHPPVAHLIVNGATVPVGGDGLAQSSVEVGVGAFLRLDAVFANGARVVLRRLRHGDGLSPRPIVHSGRGLPVVGRLRGDRSLRIGTSDVDLSALSVRLRPMAVAVPLNPAGTGLAEHAKGPKAACVGICFGNSSDMAMEGWELRLFAVGASGEKSRLIRTIKGVGPVPPLVSWDGTNAQGNFIFTEGLYQARLIARGKGGLVGLSRPVHFRAYRPQQDFRVVLPDPFGDLRRRAKLPKAKIVGDAKRDFDRFVKLAAMEQGSVEVVGHVDLRLRASQAQKMSRMIAEAIRGELEAAGVDSGRITVRGEGSNFRQVMRARTAQEHAKNRRVELILTSQELPSLPPLRARSARVHSPAGDLLATRDGSLRGELFPDSGGRVTVQVEDGSGRSAQLPLDLDAVEKMPEFEVVPVIPASTADGSALPDTDAISLRVQLPANGSVLSHEQLGVFGSVLAGQRVRVNGKDVAVHPLSGRFGTTLTLKEGEQELVVEAEDPKGHVARIRRRVVVRPSGRFLMAMADLGYHTVAAGLPGLKANRSFDLGAYGRLGGRAMVWYKERWQLPEGSFFKRLRVNAYVDTDRSWGEIREFIRSDRSLHLLPQAFGDEAKEVQEVLAAGPVFLDLQADRSHLRIANFNTTLPDRELLTYQRAFYGVDLLFDHRFGDKKKPDQVVVQTYISDTAAGLRSATNLLRGTGGSFYRLRHRDLLPGSEQVRMVVRDAANGLVLFERQLRRDHDYRVDAVEGLLIMNQPLPSTAGTQMASAYGVSTADIGGHPVFLHVAYTHRDAESLASFAAGGRVDGSSKKLGLKGGVSYGYEGRADGSDAFQQAGAFASWRHKDGHNAKAELAWSRSIDGEHYGSGDGGNSFYQMGENPSQTPIQFNGRLYPTTANDGSPRTGMALALGGRALAGKWLKLKRKDDLTVETYLRHSDAGFYGGGASLDQGQTRWGLLSGYRINSRDRATLRYDASMSLVAPPLSPSSTLPEAALREYRRIHREALTLRVQRQEKRWRAGAEYQLGFTGDSWNYVDVAEDSRATVLSNVIAADGLYRVDKRWSVGGAQRAILSGDDLRFEDPFARLSTAARARYAIDKSLAIELEEELRWNGDNQTRFGLVRRPDKNLEQYVQERLTTQSGGFYNTTVLGAMERRRNDGLMNRAELHLDHALGQERASGLVGLGRRYKLLKGMTLSVNYERFQVLSGGPTLATASPASGSTSDRGSAGRVVGTSNLVGQPSAAYQGSPLLQSGMNGWGLAPVSGSRDALGVHLLYKRHRRWALSAKSELRLELADEAKLDDINHQDRLVQFHEIAGSLKLNADLTMLGRYALAEVRNLTAIEREQLSNEVSVGLALRPQHTDKYRGLLRYSRRQDLRADQRWLTQDLLAFEPVFMTPWYLQVASKFAIKADAESDPLLGSDTAMTLLFVPRLDLQLTKLLRMQKAVPIPGDIELWAEFRSLADLSAGAVQNGVALGLSYLPIKHLRVGLGYSFTAVPDRLTTSETVDGSGFFLRVSGLY